MQLVNPVLTVIAGVEVEVAYWQADAFPLQVVPSVVAVEGATTAQLPLASTKGPELADHTVVPVDVVV